MQFPLTKNKKYNNINKAGTLFFATYDLID